MMLYLMSCPQSQRPDHINDILFIFSFQMHDVTLCVDIFLNTKHF